MIRSKFHSTSHAGYPHRTVFGSIQGLKPIWLLLMVIMLVACATLPVPEGKTPSYAYDPPQDSRLAVITRDLIQDDDAAPSGFFKLFRNDDAMHWRLLLIDLAEETLDMQYFIWKADASGDMLLDRVIKAADRGVRVRILIDDIYIIGADRTVAALSQHPNIQIRLFNPMEQRTTSTLLFVLEYLGRIEQLNHRMHNKVIVADNRFAVIGGRNIGNEYFGLNPKQNFTDFDVLVFGAVAKKASNAFDIYWNNQWAYPGEALLQNFKDEQLLPQLLEELQEELEKKEAKLVEFQQRNPDGNTLLERLERNMKSGTASVIYDEPLVGEKTPPMQLIETMGELAVNAQDELLISTPYFIPDEDFYRDAAVMISRGFASLFSPTRSEQPIIPLCTAAIKNTVKR